MSSRVKPKKGGWHIQERFDLKRKKLGLPRDTGPTLLEHRRQAQRNALMAKRPHESRLIQRQKNLAAIAARHKARDDRKAALTRQLEALKPTLSVIEAA